MKPKIKNDLTQKFSRGTILTHWLSAILLFLLITLSLGTVGEKYFEALTIIKIHLVLGSIVFLFTILRSYLLLTTKQPDSLKTGSRFIDKLAEWNHYLFYILLLAISITGIIVVFNGNYFEAFNYGSIEKIVSPKQIPLLKYHVLLIAFLILLFIMHVFGVIKHYIFNKENTLKRIL